jgi:hypothetical protein
MRNYASRAAPRTSTLLQTISSDELKRTPSANALGVPICACLSGLRDLSATYAEGMELGSVPRTYESKPTIVKASAQTKFPI